MSESESKSEEERELNYRWTREGCTMRLEKRIIALERGLEAVLRRLEKSGQPDDEAGWYGRPE